MAKKVIATLKTGKGKSFSKCIKMQKSPKSGSYIFKEEMVHVDHVKDFFAQN
jgi:ABC-type histidine transport system ATPase subunit